MFAQITSVAMIGAEPELVTIEAHIGKPQEAFVLVGLPDTAIREAKQRVKAALLSSGHEPPHRYLTVNLGPADLPKVGADYDLPIALGVLAAANLINPIRRMVVAGELSLEGRVRSSRWAVGAALLASQKGWPCLVATKDAPQAARVPGATVYGASTLNEAIEIVSEDEPPVPVSPAPDLPTGHLLDLAEVRGQPVARRALEIAAAGSHHLLMVGSPGCGKTMLAMRLPSILPPLDPELAVEVSCLWASAGRSRRLTSDPPFRSPHHSASMAAVVGGGSGHPIPGEASLAHGGVLFLDELGEFPPHLLNALRQPIEEGRVTISRRGASVTFPARSQVVAASNPCPCGFADDRHTGCRCSVNEIARYRRRLSGPFLDRFDLRLTMNAPDPDALFTGPGESSDEVRRRVLSARARQGERGKTVNSALSRRQLDQLVYRSDALDLLSAAASKGYVTARGADRVRRVARTIADLSGEDQVDSNHVAEALAFRGSV